ncbi:MAG TPA: DinB family protein [Thermoanaerobaculia bacterium]|nr:DinB family protein [Thermoanaerobaculia bacterium]
MRLNDPILGEIDRESKSTIRMIVRAPSDKLDWTPHPKSMTLGALCWHLATIPERVAIMLRRGSYDATTARPGPAPNAGDAIGVFKKNIAEIRALIDGMSDADLVAPFTMMAGERVLTTMPKIAVIRTILLNHSYHHRGQLSLYLRLLDVPLPAIYGTSADENPYG